MTANLQPPQFAKMLLFLLLLLIIPFISASMRTFYLYFLLNILIVVLGVEAGLLTAISGADGRKLISSTATAPIHRPSIEDGSRANHSNSLEAVCNQPGKPTPSEPPHLVEKKVAPVMKRVNKKIKRCPSLPSLFFIGSCETEEGHKEKVVTEDDGEYAEEEVMVVAGEATVQELVTKAEAFIGNFYKQLRMQREDSWKKIHGLYHEAF